MKTMLEVVLDMETNDPDDYLTLLLLLGHPQVKLKAVTITPGSVYQVGLVERTLKLFGVDIPIGGYNINHPKECISSWHEKAYGKIKPSTNASKGSEVLKQYCDKNTILITGAPLKNLGEALNDESFYLGKLVAQGGFAGEGVIPAEKQLEKFRGLLTCPTFNLNGDPKSALKALHTTQIGERYFVSKNVCHGVYYDMAMHQYFEDFKDKSLSLKMIYKGMDVFLNKKLDNLPTIKRTNYNIEAEEVRVFDQHKNDLGILATDDAIKLTQSAGLTLVEVNSEVHPPVCRIMEFQEETNNIIVGKKLHDPLAACCAIDPSIATWAEVEIFRQKGEWGSRLQPDTNTWIITDYNHQKFLEVLTTF